MSHKTIAMKIGGTRGQEKTWATKHAYHGFDYLHPACLLWRRTSEARRKTRHAVQDSTRLIIILAKRIAEVVQC